MRIKTFWVLYDDDLMPNVMLAVDEYLDDENPAYWREEVKKQIEAAEVEGLPWRIIEFKVSDSAVINAFKIPVSDVKGAVVLDGG